MTDMQADESHSTDLRFKFSRGNNVLKGGKVEPLEIWLVTPLLAVF